MASLFRPNRYKVRYGGRGKGSSWGFARTLIALMMDSTPLYADGHPLRVLCARETQKSIADSVHHLLETQIQRMGLQWAFTVEKAKIYSHNGGEIIFAGLKHNVNNIKSLEDVDIVWVTEAQAVSKHTWETLIPTIRKNGSEIWVDFNPELATDETYVRFVTSPPPGADVLKMTYRDNPWYPEVLKREMMHLKATDPRAYDWVYEGNCKTAVEGAVYEAEMAMLEREGRIKQVPYAVGFPVHTFWDLGWNDTTAIWFAQAVGMEYRILDYLEVGKTKLDDIVRMMQNKPYVYGIDYMPHDAVAEQFAAGGRSIQQQMQQYGRRVQIVPRLSVADGLNAVRTILPSCWIDGEKCADGLQALRHYRWAESASGMLKREPLHNWASNGADSFRYLAVSLKPQIPVNEAVRRRNYVGGVWV
jgi:phage terminase large subunit